MSVEDSRGSPPHTWRIQDDSGKTTFIRRITSTYVENTRKGFVERCLWQDHLHIRGEYGARLKKNHGNLGSPPHTWRILVMAGSNHEGNRITSTYVENTVSATFHSGRPQDHLHIRGEYLSVQDRMNGILGSPPHTWRILIR